MKRTDTAACAAILGAVSLTLSLAGSFFACALGAIGLLAVAIALYWLNAMGQSRERNTSL